MKTDAELAQANQDISTSEIFDDIRETEREIEALRAMLPGCRVLADRVLTMRVQVGIGKRTDFVKGLQAILRGRGEVPNADH